MLTALNRDKMHILLVCPGFAKDESDTACLSAVQDYILEFRSLYPNCSFTIIALQYPYEKKQYHWNGIPIHALNASRLGIVKKLLHWRETVKLAQRIHQTNPIDLIHSFWLHEAYFVASKISRRLKLPMIASGGGQEVKTGNKYLRYFKNSNCVYVTSSSLQQTLLLENYKIQSQLIPMGLRAENLVKIQEKTIDILGVGNFTENKDFSSFIRIIHQTQSQIPNLKVKLIGDGEQRAQIEADIQKYDLYDTIELTGMMAREDVCELMAQSKILLHPSKYESFGMVYLEALAHGMYVVSKKTGIAEQSDKWFLYEDKKEASNQIAQVLNQKQQHEVLMPYPSSAMVEAYKVLYSES